MNRTLVLLLTAALTYPALADLLPPDETPARPGEWGFRPAENAEAAVNPPALSWRPQPGAKAYDIQLARDENFGPAMLEVRGHPFTVFAASSPLAPGRWYWRFRSRSGEDTSSWSRARAFAIGPGATVFPMPEREDLFARIPKSHPRLFLRPEQVPALREAARGARKEDFDRLVMRCEELLRKPPPSAEPPTYPAAIERGSDPWRELWWGNRTYTMALLDGAATLAFTRLLGGPERYGEAAKAWLLAAARWDPTGSTGYRYNDEAGMPYAYYFSRTYTFVYDLLTEEERERCRRIMAVRGDEMYRHLCPRHLWQPYSSHSNRAWHFLGEVAIAFFDEIPAARDWLWFALHVQYGAYPVWCDDDGGWHEGNAYWSSYINRFTWWADVLRAAAGLDVYRLPYFARIGYYPLYQMPPGTKGGGFGDLNAGRTSSHNRDLMYAFAAQARNPYWQWYAVQQGPAKPDAHYIDFLRGLRPAPAARPPTDLPASRLFRGTGQAALNTTLLAAKDNVEILFKSSPFGTQSHGYDAQNAFLLYAYGERLLIRSGRRDSYGSDHHRDWMWETKSVNSITVDGRGQEKHSAAARGDITAFHASTALDYVAGEAGAAYGGRLKRFTRHILFFKPGLVVIVDDLETPAPASFEWRLHAPVPIAAPHARDIRVVNGGAACRVAFLEPAALALNVTDRFDVPPRPRIALREWHLAAATVDKAAQQRFVTVIQPHRAGTDPGPLPDFVSAGGTLTLKARTPGGGAELVVQGDGSLTAVAYDASGQPVERVAYAPAPGNRPQP